MEDGNADKRGFLYGFVCVNYGRGLSSRPQVISMKYLFLVKTRLIRA